jgi:hypothetical protein
MFALKRLRLIVLVIALVSFGSAVKQEVHADMRILDSNTNKYQVGDVVPDNTTFNLGVGCRVRVLVLSSMVTKLFEGPKPNERDIILGLRGPPPC